LNPILLILLAPVGLIFTAVLYFAGEDDEQARALARARPAPAAVAIETFDARRDRGPSGEVVVVGQVDTAMRVSSSRSKDGNVTDRHVIMPIYPVSARSIAEPARGVLVQQGRLRADQLDRFKIGDGPIGPVLRLNGQLLADHEAKRGLEAGFGGQVLITRSALYIDPYEEGRDAALAPNTSGRDAAIFMGTISLLIGLLGAFLQWRRVKREREESDGYYGTSY
jgi:hypothetical protein